jgi:hypothetical protein
VRYVADAMMVTTFVAAISFVAIYLRRNWRSSQVGWNLMAFGVVLVIETGLALSTLIFGRDWAARELVRAIAWALIGGVMWWRVVLVARPPASPADPTSDALREADPLPGQRTSSFSTPTSSGSHLAPTSSKSESLKRTGIVGQDAGRDSPDLPTDGPPESDRS